MSHKEDRAPQCPASSEIGDVRFDTPLIGSLTGKVYFGTPTPTAKLRNFVSVEDPCLRVKLVGDVTVDPQTGQVTNVFADAQQCRSPSSSSVTRAARAPC